MIKILYLDIETTPTLGYAYEKYDATMIQVKEESFMLSFAYKWENEKTIRAKSLADYPLFKKEPHNDIELLKEVAKLLDKADIVIAHNGDRFDIKMIQGYMLRRGILPPSPFKSVDTLRIAKGKFRLFSNKLTDLACILDVGSKIAIEHDVWNACMEGDREAFNELIQYNKHDVYLLEAIYKKMLPWITNHPHIDPEMGALACENCGSTKLQSRGKSIVINGFKPRHQCQDCGHWGHGKLQKHE